MVISDALPASKRFCDRGDLGKRHRDEGRQFGCSRAQDERDNVFRPRVRRPDPVLRCLDTQVNVVKPRIPKRRSAMLSPAPDLVWARHRSTLPPRPAGARVFCSGVYLAPLCEDTKPQARPHLPSTFPAARRRRGAPGVWLVPMPATYAASLSAGVAASGVQLRAQARQRGAQRDDAHRPEAAVLVCRQGKVGVRGEKIAIGRVIGIENGDKQPASGLSSKAAACSSAISKHRIDRFPWSGWRRLISPHAASAVSSATVHLRLVRAGSRPSGDVGRVPGP